MENITEHPSKNITCTRVFFLYLSSSFTKSYAFSDSYIKDCHTHFKRHLTRISGPDHNFSVQLYSINIRLKAAIRFSPNNSYGNFDFNFLLFGITMILFYFCFPYRDYVICKMYWAYLIILKLKFRNFRWRRFAVSLWMQPEPISGHFLPLPIANSITHQCTCWFHRTLIITNPTEVSLWRQQLKVKSIQRFR